MALIKRSFTLHGHRTSLALEPEFWAVVDEEAERRDQAIAALIAEIDLTRDPDDSLSSIVRVWALTTVQERLDPNPS